MKKRLRNPIKPESSKKNAKFYRVTSDEEDPLSGDRKYGSFTKSGKNSYESKYYDGLIGHDVGIPKTITYETIKDLKVATSDEVESYIASLYPDKVRMDTIRSDVRNLQNSFMWDPPKNDVERYAMQYVQKGERMLGTRYHETLFQDIYKGENRTNPVFEHFRSLGYDAISDVEDGGLSISDAPAIILDPKNSLRVADTYTWKAHD